MSSNNSSIIAIGWDVRGWRGNQQAVAVLKLDALTQVFQWWISDDFQFKTGMQLSLSSLLEPAIGDNYEAVISNVDRVILGIDAPLAFSQAFTRLLIDDNSEYLPSCSQMDNPLAYRKCERWIKDEHSKTPLSAAFDKLGNGATLAISLTHTLKKEEFSLVPQDALDSNKAIIEVYPGIVKVGARREMPAIEPVDKLIPNEIRTGSDQYDAAICAIMAAIFAGAAGQLHLPKLDGFQPDYDPKEGWIYGLPAQFVKQYQ